MGFLKFLTSGTFFKHLGIAIVFVALLIWLTLKVLNLYTQHGNEIEVPGFTGINIDKVGDMDIGEDFEFVVIDSVYDDHFSKGEIVLQDPIPGSSVKSGRKIYVTIVANQPEMVTMPDLVDLSLRQALSELKANSLKLDKLDYVPNFAKNAVLAQRLEGDTIDVGVEILKGTPIELVMGAGLNNDKVEIPFLIGKTENESIKILNNLGLNVGYLKYLDGRDKIHSRVYEQQPQPIENAKIEYGAYVDLWFRHDGLFDFDSLVANYITDPLLLESDSIPTQTMEE